MTAQLSSLATQTKAEAAYSQLRRLIIEGGLEPGSPIDQEQIAQRLGVSTTPLREAVRRLEGERLLIVVAHTQVTVAQLSLEELKALYETRLQLDPLAARLAANRASEAEREVMRTFLDGDHGTDPFTQLQRNRELHRSVYRACGNPVLTDITEILWDRSDRFRYVLLKNTPGLVSPHVGRDSEHDSLLNAVIEGRPKPAERIMREHLLATLAYLEHDAPALSHNHDETVSAKG
ncbi:MAG TPA: GntR family transcriptional regulator [Actinocrinis sp.]|jgi:DNA-binding GntR family transcriptional regulator